MRLPQIQGLRALAALLVVFYHAGFIDGGYIGVDVFYVISGFLITGLIVREVEQETRFNFRAFYKRRILRLLPASFFIALVTVVFTFFAIAPSLRTQLAKEFLVANTYVSNFLFAYWDNDYQNLDAQPSVFLHYWSLAVEEQFYLVWPFLLVLFYKIKLLGIRKGVLLIGVGSFVTSIVCTYLYPVWAFYSLPTRAWELAAGALLFIYRTEFSSFSKRFIPYLGVALLLFSSFNLDNQDRFPGYKALLPVLGTGLLLLSINSWPSFLEHMFSSKLAVWLGNISYSTYLWHWPILVVPVLYLGRELNFPELLLCVVLTIACAHWTTKYIENPMRSMALSQFRTALLLLLSVLIAGAISLFISSTNNSQITVQNSYFSFDYEKTIRKPLINADKCHITHGQVQSPQCLYGDKEAEKSLVLFGDSHAAQWFPALDNFAKSNGYQLFSFTKSACPAANVKLPDKGGFKDAECKKWRQLILKRIKEISPAAVIMSGFQHFTPPSDVANPELWWKSGLSSLRTELQDVESRLIYIGDTPTPMVNVPECLAKKSILECSKVKKSPEWKSSDFLFVNPTSWLCKETCPVVIGNIVAYRDRSHISVDMALRLTEELSIALSSRL